MAKQAFSDDFFVISQRGLFWVGFIRLKGPFNSEIYLLYNRFMVKLTGDGTAAKYFLLQSAT